MTRFHGHTISELEAFLYDACPVFDGEVSLNDHSLGGWSNINIQGRSGDLDFVLKLPSSTPPHNIAKYKNLYDLGLFFNRLKVAPLPLAVGELPDKTRTPFLIFEYVNGVIHEDITDFSEHDIESLRSCLHLIAKQTPHGLLRYESASHYLLSMHALVENHLGFSRCSQEIMELVESFNEIFSRVLSYTDSLEPWPFTFMHGDLWLPNIVFQDGMVVLLDFEACAYGNRFFDLSYLLETANGVSQEISQRLLLPEEVEEVDSLRPPVVAFLIDWSIERLLSMETGMIQPELATKKIRSSILGYIRSKITRLESIMS